MKNIRIGNDIWFKWQILRDEGVETWDGKDIKVTLRDSYGMECAVDWRKDEDGVINGVCRGRAQKRLGLYTLTLTENDGKDNMGCVDSVDAWRLVARQNASIVDEEERDGALGVEVVMLTSKVGIGTGEGITIDTELDEQSNNAIANSAVTKGINAVGEISEKDLQEVVGVGTGGYVPSTKPKEIKEQIIIGRAIKPKACDIGNVKNLYVFHTPTIPVYARDFAEECKVFLKNQQLKKISQIHDTVLLYAYPEKDVDFLMEIIVLGYEMNSNGEITTLRLRDHVVNNHETVKDSTSKRISWVQGKRVYDDCIKSKDLYNCLTNKYAKGYDIYVIRKRPRCKKIREQKDYPFLVKNRRRAVKISNKVYGEEYRIRPGLYKCRVNHFGKKSEWQYFYVRFKKGNPQGDITIKEIK